MFFFPKAPQTPPFLFKYFCLREGDREQYWRRTATADSSCGVLSSSSAPITRSPYTATLYCKRRATGSFLENLLRYQTFKGADLQNDTQLISCWNKQALSQQIAESPPPDAVDLPAAILSSSLFLDHWTKQLIPLQIAYGVCFLIAFVGPLEACLLYFSHENRVRTFPTICEPNTPARSYHEVLQWRYTPRLPSAGRILCCETKTKNAFPYQSTTPRVPNNELHNWRAVCGGILKITTRRVIVPQRKQNSREEALCFCSECSVAIVGLPESLEEVGTRRHDGVGVERLVGRVVVLLPRGKRNQRGGATNGAGGARLSMGWRD